MQYNLDLILTSIMRLLLPREEYDAYTLVALSPFVFIFIAYAVKYQLKIFKKDKGFIALTALITLCIILVYFGLLTIFFLIGILD